MRKTKIVPWPNEWETLYSLEEKHLKEIFKDEMLGIYHIGSTSIPVVGYAKPTIDILISVKDIEMIDEYNEKMCLQG